MQMLLLSLKAMHHRGTRRRVMHNMASAGESPGNRKAKGQPGEMAAAISLKDKEGKGETGVIVIKLVRAVVSHEEVRAIRVVKRRLIHRRIARKAIRRWVINLQAISLKEGRAGVINRRAAKVEAINSEDRVVIILAIGAINKTGVMVRDPRKGTRIATQKEAMWTDAILTEII